eukprot:CAMPEP_0115849120 /NCGR_PEP_ID=MMETSP0287-20121206/11284_1 /TAXON_ID=412157 /ORGANISM="Chrysochromulina rotalis, Strain UIO044" /LENGTH=52 /DNA_ID=CAMNT_0003303075 /DNA_START=409 /DNA_END=563 /DNA_ORIENTATION=-
MALRASVTLDSMRWPEGGDVRARGAQEAPSSGRSARGTRRKAAKRLMAVALP